MNKRTLTALRGSIRKWEGIVAGTVTDEGPNNCPLCGLFFNLGCEGCPVSAAAERPYCENTPYDVWDTGAPQPERKAIAQAELDFLRGLLPKKVGKRS
jgi:hypothetical protein